MKKQSEGKMMLLTAMFMSAATMLSKVLGLVRDSMIAANFGTGMEADAFVSATKLPTTMFDMVIGGVISASFIPIFAGIMTAEGKKAAMKFANKFITLILMITIAITIVGILFARPLTEFIAPSYAADKFELTLTLTRIMFPMIIFTGLAFSFVGILQSLGEFNIPSIISLVSNAVIILYFIIFGDKYGVKGLAVTMVIAWSLQAIVQIPSLVRFKYKYRVDFALKDDNIKKIMLLAGPMLISTWVQPLSTLITARLASGIDGAYSSLEYANRLYIIVTGVFSFVVTNLIFPKLSKANVLDDKKQARGLVSVSVKSIIMVILPIMAGFMILSTPITSIIYEHGKLDETGVGVVSGALRFYSIGMIGLAVNEIISKTFFSMKDSKTPMVTAIISMLFNISLAYVLFSFMKTNGLALAIAIGSIFNAVLNLLILLKRDKNIFSKDDAEDILKTVFSTIVMAVVVFILYRILYVEERTMINQMLICAVCGGVGAIVYGIMLFVTRQRLIYKLIGKEMRKSDE